MRLDGSGIETLVNYIVDFSVVNNWIFYNTGYDLYRINTEGSSKLLIAENCYSFIVGGGYVFVTDIASEYFNWRFKNKIIRYNLDGSGETLLFTGEESFMSQISFGFIDGGYLYYSYANEIQRMKHDGSNRKVIAGGGQYLDFVLKDGMIYYICYFSGKPAIISKINLDGTGEQKIREIDRYVGIRLRLIGDSFFFTTSNPTILNRLSINGEHSVVYNKPTSDLYYGIFAHGDTLFLLLKQI
jgi:hypothetical protein